MIPASDRAPGTPSASLGLGLLICRMNTEVLAPWGHSAVPTDDVFLVGTKEGGRALPGGERPRAGHGANPSLMPRRAPPHNQEGCGPKVESADAEKAESESLPRAQSWREDGHVSLLPNPERARPWLNSSLRSGKSDRERRTSYDIAYMWNLKKKMLHMNLFAK